MFSILKKKCNIASRFKQTVKSHTQKVDGCSLFQHKENVLQSFYKNVLLVLMGMTSISFFSEYPQNLF